MPVTAFADRKNAWAAAMSRCSEQYVDQVPVPVDGAIQIAPAPVHLQVCLIHIPAAAHLAAPAPPQLLGQGRREFGLPLPDRLMTEHDAAHGEHLGQIA